MTLPIPDETEFEAEMSRLRAAEAPFAVATVVRTLAATSAKPGAKALIDAAGTLRAGWLGGGCARTAIGRAARAAIAERQPRFVSIRPEELLEADGVTAGEEREGVHFARNGCPSKGSMDVFVEPVLPRPRLVICGTGPVARALAGISARFGFHRVVCAPGTEAAAWPCVEEVVDGHAPDSAARFHVVATQGMGDAPALRAAVASAADYVAFVGSRRKFAALSERLAAEGADRSALARVHAPAGLDIAAITPDEIALSILAEIVAHRRTGDRTATTAPVPDPLPDR
ncbi:XdhC family protein [Roseovarius ramblicola]|uniref:XdhC family protein n=1 Tax=Roseovarius ramblicola TaxID=2022336 RepID=A0ABV5I113_9RHOB